MSQDDNCRLVAKVTGYVQGVGYRFFAEAGANRLGLTGYVRNMPDGSVEVVAEGPRGALEDLLALLRKGPFGAEVTDARYAFVPPQASSGILALGDGRSF